ncbi:unnamed protein product [Prorocentrum cordatum]|uniref:Uncharacterized protein n=1 Tax=Prorocentrum cordatum TaxID=2364126 RepID=A0ABN9U9N0_9DINO|nr:unnamed protein product [Polarella glacialis]
MEQGVKLLGRQVAEIAADIRAAFPMPRDGLEPLRALPPAPPELCEAARRGDQREAHQGARLVVELGLRHEQGRLHEGLQAELADEENSDRPVLQPPQGEAELCARGLVRDPLPARGRAEELPRVARGPRVAALPQHAEPQLRDAPGGPAEVGGGPQDGPEAEDLPGGGREAEWPRQVLLVDVGVAGPCAEHEPPVGVGLPGRALREARATRPQGEARAPPPPGAQGAGRRVRDLRPRAAVAHEDRLHGQARPLRLEPAPLGAEPAREGLRGLHISREISAGTRMLLCGTLRVDGPPTTTSPSNASASAPYKECSVPAGSSRASLLSSTSTASGPPSTSPGRAMTLAQVSLQSDAAAGRGASANASWARPGARAPAATGHRARAGAASPRSCDLAAGPPRGWQPRAPSQNGHGGRRSQQMLRRGCASK